MTHTRIFLFFLFVFVSAFASAQSDSDLFTNHLKTRDMRPNIVLIVMDDVGIGDLAPLNHSSRDISMSFYESLLKRKTSVRLSNYYTHSFCTPARASILSGIDCTCL